jgi:hypothetical protein
MKSQSERAYKNGSINKNKRDSKLNSNHAKSKIRGNGWERISPVKSERKDTSRKKGNINHAAVVGTIRESPATPLLSIDKLTVGILLVDVSEDEQKTVIKRMREWLNGKRFKKGSSKGKGFKYVFLKIFDDAFSIEVRVEPNRREHARQFLNITLNPANVGERHVTWLHIFFQKLFPGRWREIIAALRLYRVDVCVDIPVDVDSLIVRQRRGCVESKFFVASDGAGCLQTIYLGSIASEIHGTSLRSGCQRCFQKNCG